MLGVLYKAYSKVPTPIRIVFFETFRFQAKTIFFRSKDSIVGEFVRI